MEIIHEHSGITLKESQDVLEFCCSEDDNDTYKDTFEQLEGFMKNEISEEGEMLCKWSFNKSEGVISTLDNILEIKLMDIMKYVKVPPKQSFSPKPAKVSMQMPTQPVDSFEPKEYPYRIASADFYDEKSGNEYKILIADYTEKSIALYASGDTGEISKLFKANYEDMITTAGGKFIFGLKGVEGEHQYAKAPGYIFSKTNPKVNACLTFFVGEENIVSKASKTTSSYGLGKPAGKFERKTPASTVLDILNSTPVLSSKAESIPPKETKPTQTKDEERMTLILRLIKLLDVPCKSVQKISMDDYEYVYGPSASVTDDEYPDKIFECRKGNNVIFVMLK